MKRPRTKFASKSPKPKFEGGGFLDFLKQPGIGSAIGTGMSAFGTMLGQNEPKMPSGPISANSMDALQTYQKEVADSKKVQAGIGTAFDAIGEVGSKIPGIGGLIQAGAGVGKLITNILPFGKKKQQKALNAFKEKNEFNRQQDMALQGRMNQSMIGEYKAPAYGRKGMKFKSKFSKPC